MPEGPSVRNTVDELRAALEGERLTAVRSSLKKATAEDWAGRLVGCQVLKISAHGKHMLLEFEGGWVIHTHFMMWGAWHVYAPGEPWRKKAQQARLVLETQQAVAVLFSAPICELVRSSEVSTQVTGDLGPDLMAEEFGAAQASEVLARWLTDPERAVGEAVMDQRSVAGIGNILKSEILFAVGVHPLRPVATLTTTEVEQILVVGREFMQRAYVLGGFKGTFLPPALSTMSLTGYVYQRSGQPCFNCGSRIRMVRQGMAERMTFFCPVCQPLDPAHPLAPEVAVQTPFTNTVHSLEEARNFVLAVGLCGILHDAKGKLPTLWDAVAAPEKQPGEPGWGEKMSRVWTWKNELPTQYPADVFYGKIKGGRAVLMSMPMLHEHYARNHLPLAQCSPLAQALWSVIAQAPIATVPLRQLIGMTERKARTQFDKALIELQTTFNIARSNAPGLEQDTWVPFSDQYPQFATQSREA